MVNHLESSTPQSGKIIATSSINAASETLAYKRKVIKLWSFKFSGSNLKAAVNGGDMAQPLLN